MGCGTSVPEPAPHGDTKGLLSGGGGGDSGHLRSSAANFSTMAPEVAPPPVVVPQPKKAPAPPRNNINPGPPQQQPPPPVRPKPKPNKPVNRARDRYDMATESKTLQTSGIKMRYAYLSQRGHYPDDPNKANQDAYCIAPRLISGKNDVLFGVFDGHGQTGDYCAQFVKKNLPPQIKKEMEKSLKSKRVSKNNQAAAATLETTLSKGQLQASLTRAHVECNRQLHRNTTIDDSLSGTTAVSMYFHGRRNRITIANVGDSRAVLGQENTLSLHGAVRTRENSANKTLKAYPLSRDQTPYRKDERARIRATGARVLSLDQLEGLEPIVEGEESENMECELGEELDEGGDPPRVWAAHGDYPGTAFTRSLGDAMAEDLGVFAEPEMLTRELTPQDKILVLASDGVFEFLTNQSVIDICAKFTDPLEACRAVVAEAYELWLQYELRTDDITMICIFLDDVRPAPDQQGSVGSSLGDSQNKQATLLGRSGPSPGDQSDDEIDNSMLTSEGLKPVRKNVSKEKSKEIEKLKELGRTMRNNDGIEDEAFDWRKHATEKTPAEKKGIADAIKASVMFRNINSEQREMIFACMESVKVKAGTWVIRQGTVGDRYYIIDEGRFEVRIVPDDEEDETGEGGNIVHVYEGSRERHAHPAFGELALMYSAPRSASIVAQTDGHLWALHRSAFRQVLLEAQDDRKDLKRVLGEIPYFQFLDSEGINNIATIMDERTFGRGENIIEQGKPGNMMYVVKTGSAYSVQMTQSGTKRKNIGKFGSFGEEVLGKGQGKYNMTVVALHTTACWQLDNTILEKTMGPMLRGESK